MTRILFVCHGNICRSPMAEFCMKDLVRKAGREAEFEIESAATTSEELGHPVYPPARRELAAHGIACAGKTARRAVRGDYARFDRIVGMDEENRRDLLRLFTGDPDGKVSLLLDGTDRPRSVADPWYTGDFGATWRDVLAGCTALLAATARPAAPDPEPAAPIHIVLLQPEIPHNTGAIGRLCVGLGCDLALVRPLGFRLSEGAVRRAGLDYWPHLRLSVHDNWEAYLAAAKPSRLHFLSTRGGRSLYEARFAPGDALVFGCESAGLPAPFYERYREALLRIPMPGAHARSLNLANAVSVAAYEAYRQLRPAGGLPGRT